MSTLYERYIINDDSELHIYGSALFIGQSFTPAVAHKITSVKLLICRDLLPGWLDIEIYTTVDGHPDTLLCSGGIDANQLKEHAEADPYVWTEITLGAGANLDAGVQYVIVGKALDGDENNHVRWRCDTTVLDYAGGCLEYSDNGGATWATYTGWDMMFEDWGDPIVGVAGFGGNPSDVLVKNALI